MPTDHWNPAQPHARRIYENRGETKKVMFNGLDPTVNYLPVAAVARMAGVAPKVVRYALSKDQLQAARRQKGRAGVLIDPDEAARWIESRRKHDASRDE